MRFMIFIPFLFLVVTSINAKPYKFLEDVICKGYDSCAPTFEDKLNVHIIPHSHDDVGWTKTVDQYYYQQVQSIISSVIPALKQNPDRRFIQVEIAFFDIWWRDQPDNIKQDVIDLINEGRLVITNGAWSMNDEATTHYQSIIDQFTLGLRYVQDNLGKCARPSIGWQIDPFGHSREQASLFSQMGFDGVLFARIDYRDKNKRLEEKNMDLIWSGSNSLGSDSDIFTSILFEHYRTPDKFCWDIRCSDPPIVMDEESPEYNWEQRVNDFATFIEKVGSHYDQNNVLLTYGGDFRWEAAINTFVNIDRLIKGFQKFNPKVLGKEVNLIYSTPGCYTKAVNDHVIKNNVVMDTKTDDFFPYADSANKVWTGYFTSRPASKRYERLSNNLLQVAKQLKAIANFPQNTTLKLEKALGVMQHHDAITGTEKQHVVNDYHRQITIGLNEVTDTSNKALSKLLDPSQDLKLQSCLLANVSICKSSESNQFHIGIYNPLSKTVSSYIQIPVDLASWGVFGPDDQQVESILSDPIRDFSYISENVESYKVLPKILSFKAENIPPFGFKSYYVEAISSIAQNANEGNEYPVEEIRFEDNYVNFDADFDRSRKVEISNEFIYYKGSHSDKGINNDESYRRSVNDAIDQIGFEDNYVNFDTETGLIKSITLKGVTLEVSQELMYYKSSDASGAYVFRPDTNERNALKFSEKVENTVLINSGDIVREVRQKWNDWAQQVIRVHKNEDYIEFDWVIGPIDVSDNVGKEIISRFSTNLKTNGVFLTDSNGRQMIPRKKNYRPTYNYTTEEPQANNYYPVTSKISIKDDETQFSVLNDRAEGGTSLNDGQVELMIHRAMLHDDGKGVGEALNEQEYNLGLIARGSHYVTFGKIAGDGTKTQSAIERDIALRKLLQPSIFYTTASLPLLTQSFVTKELPENIHLLTLDKWSENAYLIRLEHILEIDEDPELSKETTVDLTDLFTTFTITSLKEYNLAANVPLEEISRLSWPQITKSEDGSVSMEYRLRRDADDLKITLAPMQIRTFLATIVSKN